MSRRHYSDAVAHRLREWIKELNTNRHGMAQFAPNAIAALQYQAAYYRGSFAAPHITEEKS